MSDAYAHIYVYAYMYYFNDFPSVFVDVGRVEGKSLSLRVTLLFSAAKLSMSAALIRQA